MGFREDEREKNQSRAAVADGASGSGIQCVGRQYPYPKSSPSRSTHDPSSASKRRATSIDPSASQTNTKVPSVGAVLIGCQLPMIEMTEETTDLLKQHLRPLAYCSVDRNWHTAGGVSVALQRSYPPLGYNDSHRRGTDSSVRRRPPPRVGRRRQGLALAEVFLSARWEDSPDQPRRPTASSACGTR